MLRELADLRAQMARAVAAGDEKAVYQAAARYLRLYDQCYPAKQ